MAEWLNAAVLKTVRGLAVPRGFKSFLLRHCRAFELWDYFLRPMVRMPPKFYRINKERGNSRIKTLLSYFNAEEKLVDPFISIDRAVHLIKKSTDFDNLNFRLKKNESMSYIKDNLKKC